MNGDYTTKIKQNILHVKKRLYKMRNKQNISIICGGRSFEHSLSISSAKNIASIIDDNKNFNLTILCINKKGEWFYGKVENITE